MMTWLSVSCRQTSLSSSLCASRGEKRIFTKKTRKQRKIYRNSCVVDCRRARSATNPPTICLFMYSYVIYINSHNPKVVVIFDVVVISHHRFDENRARLSCFSEMPFQALSSIIILLSSHQSLVEIVVFRRHR